MEFSFKKKEIIQKICKQLIRSHFGTMHRPTYQLYILLSKCKTKFRGKTTLLHKLKKKMSQFNPNSKRKLFH